MNKKTLWALAVFIVVPMLLHAHADGRVVHMTSNGFEPKNITIKQGETVEFENVDTRGRWPASNLHPTHTLYPGSDIKKCDTEVEKNIFDACREISPNKTYFFTFMVEGMWRFHDHIYPQYFGSITVEKTDVSAMFPLAGNQDEPQTGFFTRMVGVIKNFFRKVFDVFSSRADEAYNGEQITDIANVPAKLVGALKSLGVAATMAKLVEESGGGSTFDCHQEAHQVGRAGYQLFKEKTFEACDSSCHSGCYHGAMEMFLTEKGTRDLSASIDHICSLFSTSFGVFECLHGVGHGLLAYMDYDLPGALKECRHLSDSFKQSSCYGGVFMENIITGQGLGAIKGTHVTEWVNRTDPAFPCNAVDQAYDIKYQCWQMQTSWILTINNYDFDKVAKLCLDAPDNMIQTCFRSFGRDVAGHTLRNPARIKELCARVPVGASWHDDCVVGAVNVIIDFWGPGLKDQATELCKILNGESKYGCYTTVASRLGELFAKKADQERVCSTFESAYQNLCMF